MKNKLFITLCTVLSLSISPSFAFMIVQDPGAIANQILQLADSGSTLSNIIQSTQEGIRLAQSTYKGFKKVIDADGNVYDALSGFMEGGMDIAGQGMRFAQTVSREDMDWNTYNLIDGLISTGSELIQATEYNVNYATAGSGWVPNGRFDENTGEWIWNTHYNLKIPTSRDIEKTYKTISKLVDKSNNNYQKKLNEIAQEKQKVIESANIAIENAKDAGEDLSSNAAVQSAIQSAELALKSLEQAEANLMYAEQKQQEENNKLFSKKAAQEFNGVLNDDIIATDAQLQAIQKRLDALNNLNKK